ncbi:DUF202 domain-containing protein [Nocardia sp. NPDC059177]|uniref:DUF202 domain-containing protein n=1 Tax=Nocardia sp. NPDC059177 TaxID=3346759 RepID=UPI00368F6D3C
MTAPTLAMERTSLAWRRTSLGAAGCALLFAHEATRDGWPTIILPLVAAIAALLLSWLGWLRGHALHHGHTASGHRLVATTALTITAVSSIAILGVFVGD